MSVHVITLILHVLGACVVVGVVFFSLIFSTSGQLDEFKLKTIKAIRQFGVYGMGLVVLTGIALAYQDRQVLNNRWFWLKIALVVVDYFVSVRLINEKVGMALNEHSPDKVAPTLRRLAWLSALIFLVIVTIGVSLVENH